MTTDLKADHSETTVDCSLQELQEQLDKNLKLCLSQKRAGSVGPELRQEIKHIVQKYPEGLSISKLPILYKQYTGKDLPFRDLGFMSVLDLVGSLGDMLHFENTMDQQAMTLFDAEIKSKEKVIEPNFLHADILSSWSTSTEKREPLKPLMVKVSNAEENQMWKLLDIEGSGTVPDIPPDAVRKQKLHCLPRMSRGFMISVFVENVTSPSEFYIRGYGKGTSEKLEDMMLEMRRCYSHEFVSNRYKIPADFVLVGEVYTVCKPGDVWWYRVIVHSVINSEEVQVYYPDYGNVATVKRSWLRFLKACYMTLPAQALPASLAYMTPVQDHWPTEAIKVFQHFHIRGPVIGIAVQYMSDRLYLFLCDTSTDEDVYLHQLLIDRGFASMTQELGSCKIMKKCSSFVHYLVPSSEKPEDSFHEPSVSSENCTAELQKEQPQVQMKEETESEMPHLETVFTGEDVWDESCSFYGCTLTANCTVQPSSETKDVQHSVQSSHEKALDSKVKQDQQEGSILKKALDSKIEQEQKEGSVLKPITASVPNSDVAGLPSPIEEFYISLIKSRKSLQLFEAPNTAPSQRYLNDVNTAQKNYEL
ncbi:tudor domain-containing protein 5 isoform X2 [Hyperolius riggenbachi]|uniref:tudor domain-containing protein 5 isoform X2 n=1 Tax=Hyperolius riggenbachi TaxID=752182 RepID=UPI0035A3040E